MARSPQEIITATFSLIDQFHQDISGSYARGVPVHPNETNINTNLQFQLQEWRKKPITSVESAQDLLRTIVMYLNNRVSEPTVYTQIQEGGFLGLGATTKQVPLPIKTKLEGLVFSIGGLQQELVLRAQQDERQAAVTVSSNAADQEKKVQATLLEKLSKQLEDAQTAATANSSAADQEKKEQTEQFGNLSKRLEEMGSKITDAERRAEVAEKRAKFAEDDLRSVRATSVATSRRTGRTLNHANGGSEETILLSESLNKSRGEISSSLPDSHRDFFTLLCNKSVDLSCEFACCKLLVHIVANADKPLGDITQIVKNSAIHIALNKDEFIQAISSYVDRREENEKQANTIVVSAVDQANCDSQMATLMKNQTSFNIHLQSLSKQSTSKRRTFTGEISGPLMLLVMLEGVFTKLGKAECLALVQNELVTHGLSKPGASSAPVVSAASAAAKLGFNAHPPTVANASNETAADKPSTVTFSSTTAGQ